MNDDKHKFNFGLIGATVVSMILFAFFYNTRYTSTLPALTPVPTLLPATMPPAEKLLGKPAAGQCSIAATEFIGAWVSAGAPETEVFQFADASGKNCEATFAEVAPLFTKLQFWYADSLSCASCHSVDVTISSAQLDLSSHAGIVAGSRRADAKSKGADILGGGKWDGSLLQEFLAKKAEVSGHSNIMTDAVISVGKPAAPPEPIIATVTVTQP